MDQLVLDILAKQDRNSIEAEELITYFRDLAFFRQFLADVYPDVLQEIFMQVKMEQFQPGQIIFKQGDFSNNKMYIIIKGKVMIIIKQQTEGNNKFILLPEHQQPAETKIPLGKGSHFGEKALIERGGKRMASAVAEEQCNLLILSRSNYLQIKVNVEERQKRIRQIMLDVIPEVDKIVSQQIVEQLAYCLNYVHYSKGEYVTVDGKLGDAIYIQTKGICEISKRIDFQIKQRNEIKKKANLDKVERTLYVKLCQTTPFEVIGCDSFFQDKDEIMGLFKKLSLLPKNSEQLIQQALKQQTYQDDNDESRRAGRYWYKVQVMTRQASFLKLSIKDLFNKFPRDSVSSMQLQFLLTHYQRYLQSEQQHQEISDKLQDQDKKVWLNPSKHEISQKRQQTYVTRLYTDYLLSMNPPEKKQLTTPEKSPPKLPPQKKSKHFRVPSTFDFGRENLKVLELEIQHELASRNLLPKPEKQDYRDQYGDIMQALKSKVNKIRRSSLFNSSTIETNRTPSKSGTPYLPSIINQKKPFSHQSELKEKQQNREVVFSSANIEIKSSPIMRHKRRSESMAHLKMSKDST